jgi:hypothetical protein
MGMTAEEKAEKEALKAAQESEAQNDTETIVTEQPVDNGLTGDDPVDQS